MGVNGRGASGIALPLAVALMAGVLAAVLFHRQVDRAATVGGRPVPVLQTAQRIEAGRVIRAEDVESFFAQRSIPSDFVPADAVATREELVGVSLIAALDQGAVVTRPLLNDTDIADEFTLRPGERAVSVGVRVAPDGTVLAAGDRVDLIASGFDGAPQSELVLASAQVLVANESESKPGVQRLTLRVRARQAAPLVRADVFAREVRAVKVSSK